jgi:adenylate cyclase
MGLYELTWTYNSPIKLSILRPYIGDTLINKDPESFLPIKDEITRQLEQMLASPDFNATPQQIALLKYVVSRTQEGKADSIKGYTVATEVFGRRSDFDQSIDPIVSIQASRLRLAMERYYETAGKNDPIRIDIPKGTYVPSFEKRPHALTTGTAIDGEHQDIRVKSSWPSVLIRPLRNISGDSELDFWGIGLATELADELNHYPDIRVMTLKWGNPNTEADQHTAKFVLDGSVRSDGTSIKMILKLTETRTGRQIWSDSRRSAVEAAGIIAFQEEIAQEVAAKIAGGRGLILKTMSKDYKRHPPKHMDVYQAVLHYYEFDLHGTPQAFSRALTALEKAVTIEPECGQVWTMLARLFADADIYAIDIPGYEHPLDTAFEYAVKGIRLSPDDQRSRVIMAYIHLLRDDLKAGLVEAERALNLSPRTLFELDSIGFLLTHFGKWERGPALIEKVMQLNPFYGNYCHHALWLNCLRQKDYAGAYQETMNLKRPANFWDPLVKAATLGLLERYDEGERFAEKLLELKPDFPGNARDLIGRYIKFEEIVERVIEGLNKVGLGIE